MIYLIRIKAKNGRTKLVRTEKETKLRLNILASRLEEFDGEAWNPR
jgi:hypothetical protein